MGIGIRNNKILPRLSWNNLNSWKHKSSYSWKEKTEFHIVTYWGCDFDFDPNKCLATVFVRPRGIMPKGKFSS